MSVSALCGMSLSSDIASPMTSRMSIVRQHGIVQFARKPKGECGAETVVVENGGVEVAAEDGFLGSLRLGFAAHRIPDGRLVERLSGAVAVQQGIRLYFDGVAHGTLSSL